MFYLWRPAVVCMWTRESECICQLHVGVRAFCVCICNFLESARWSISVLMRLIYFRLLLLLLKSNARPGWQRPDKPVIRTGSHLNSRFEREFPRLWCEYVNMLSCQNSLRNFDLFRAVTISQITWSKTTLLTNWRNVWPVSH